jgi:hypothetical protein
VNKLEEIKRRAEEELAEERFREEVRREKAKILARRRFWRKLFPWTIKIERKPDV